GRNGTGELTLALPDRATIREGLHTRNLAQLVIDGAELDGALAPLRDVAAAGSPVQTITTARDPRVAGRTIVRVELRVPCTTSLRRAADGVHWRIDEEAAW
ncbi:MAG TPA: hypothetical protein VIX73_28245, partial [Kofleriaceae bacterium]